MIVVDDCGELWLEERRLVGDCSLCGEEVCRESTEKKKENKKSQFCLCVEQFSGMTRFSDPKSEMEKNYGSVHWLFISFYTII